MNRPWPLCPTFALFVGLCLTSALPGTARAADDPADHPLFAKDRLVAWCIVPFDAARRGPEERAAMLSRLGLTRLAYDWRDEHIPTFEREIQALQAHGIEFFAFWCPATDGPAYQAMAALIEKYRLHPQLWIMAPAAEAATPEARVAVNARALLPAVAAAERLGCALALYNHGGWAGEPENMVAMVQWLRRESGSDAVGIAYNFHHGHEHLARFPAAFAQMVPYLLCVNLNGMTVGGEKILPVGQGREDRRVLDMIRDAGYRGPIGILDHRAELDAEESLRQNLTGLRQLLIDMGDAAGAATYGPAER